MSSTLPGTSPAETALYQPDNPHYSTLSLCFFACSIKLAMADGEVSFEEKQAIRKLFDSHTRMHFDTLFSEAYRDTLSIRDYCRRIRVLFPHKQTLYLSMVPLLLAVALSDGALHVAEEKWILRFLQELKLEKNVLEDQLRALLLPLTKDAHTWLGLPPHASKEDIQHAYRRYAQHYHPDKLASPTISLMYQAIAKEKFILITAAYKKLLRSQ